MRTVIVAVAALLVPALAAALEPRFDHRDAHGPIAELVLSYDSVQVSGRTVTTWRPALRAGWSVDVTGEGSELIAAADVTLDSWNDPDDEKVLLAGSARFRTYFGTEEWKSFFEAGLWVPVTSILAAGPLVGLGVIHDFSQDFGVYACGEFATAFGEDRVVSFAAIGGVQVRFALP